MSREAFENWYSGRIDIFASFKIDEDGYYKDSAEQVTWKGWQACAHSRQTEVNELRAELEKAKEFLNDSCCYSHGEASFADECQWCSEVQELLMLPKLN